MLLPLSQSPSRRPSSCHTDPSNKGWNARDVRGWAPWSTRGSSLDVLGASKYHLPHGFIFPAGGSSGSYRMVESTM